MEPDDDLRALLRMNLVEIIPPGGTDDDTMFTYEEIDGLLIASQSIEEASWRGWLMKAVKVAGGAAGTLVSAQMGSEQFKWSDPGKLYDVAMRQADYWFGMIPPGMKPADAGMGSTIVSAFVPAPGINVPTFIIDPSSSSYPDEQDLSRLLRRGWRLLE